MNTQQSTIENNKLIAEFMGGLYNVHSNTYGIGKAQYKDYGDLKNVVSAQKHYSQDELLYNSDWNWLMPVVEKIETTNVKDEQVYLHTEYDNRVEFLGWYSQIDLGIKDLKDLDTRYKTKIESCFNAVVWFIKWYNKNK